MNRSNQVRLSLQNRYIVRRALVSIVINVMAPRTDTLALTNPKNESKTLCRNNQELIYRFYALRDMQFFMQLVLIYLLALSAWLMQMF